MKYRSRGFETQAQRILKHLKGGNSISPLEALGLFGAFRLGGRIHELRAAGHNIETDLKSDGYGRTYASYTLKGKTNV